MTPRTLPVTAILAAGVGMGFAGDFLLRAQGGPGLNFSLLFIGLAISIGVVAMNGDLRLSHEALGWIGLGVLLGSGLVWRGSELLRFLAFVSAATAFTLPALHAGRDWIRRAGVADVLEALVASGVHAALGGVRLSHRAQWDHVGAGETHQAARSLGRSLVIGVLLAALPLGVFGALFLSADPVFAGILEDFVRIDLASLASHAVVIAILSWFAVGYLAGFSSGTRLDTLRGLGWEPPNLRTADVAVALGLVDLLFLVFVVVQFRYLFGGTATIEVTPGLTYAAYAREGFFQLVVATALGLPWLLAAHTLLDKGRDKGAGVFQVLAGAQLVLLLLIVASALQRMRVYLEAYGLTEDRFVAAAVLLWLTLLLLWFGGTVLRGRRQSFAFGALLSGFALIVLLHLANPTAWAARSHLDRAEASLPRAGEGGTRLDVAYLSRLGSDATPILVERLDELTPEAQCEVAGALLSRWGSDDQQDWRSWNLADWRARQVVEARADRLRVLADEEGCREAAEA